MVCRIIEQDGHMAVIDKIKMKVFLDIVTLYRLESIGTPI